MKNHWKSTFSVHFSFEQVRLPSVPASRINKSKWTSTLPLSTESTLRNASYSAYISAFYWVFCPCMHFHSVVLRYGCAGDGAAAETLRTAARMANQIHPQACCSAVPLHPHRSTQFSYQRHPTCNKTCCSLSAPPKRRFTGNYAPSTVFQDLHTCILLRCSKLFLLTNNQFWIQHFPSNSTNIQKFANSATLL